MVERLLSTFTQSRPGAAHNSKASDPYNACHSYQPYRPCRQVYITMERQEKTEGKAAVDLLASYFGKSGASLLTQVRLSL